MIQVGNDPASSVYVNNKKKSPRVYWNRLYFYELPEETTEAELLDIIEDLNKERGCLWDFSTASGTKTHR